ncbi:hypothetical protein D16iCDA_20675 [Pseudomonas seleniipraecipitans]|uniref:Uncharacterized protein n=1 Tax=Phytopseudomonas seleniipraecipitans TaxID=640205 RepID=A0ABY5J7M8_9GAMM|nr:hypothetical protein [Pseudomonas seleniipraecipitans]UUD64057.1 hypothetical protein D16iCDA_20675 [Pseudomonas seleniipraecipitans]
MDDYNEILITSHAYEQTRTLPTHLAKHSKSNIPSHTTTYVHLLESAVPVEQPMHILSIGDFLDCSKADQRAKTVPSSDIAA